MDNWPSHGLLLGQGRCGAQTPVFSLRSALCCWESSITALYMAYSCLDISGLRLSVVELHHILAGPSEVASPDQR